MTKQIDQPKKPVKRHSINDAKHKLERAQKKHTYLQNPKKNKDGSLVNSNVQPFVDRAVKRAQKKLNQKKASAKHTKC